MAQSGCGTTREAGFTILEVLTAFVILAVALAAIMQIFSSGLRDAQLADEFARATMIAQSRLSDYTAAEKVQEGTSSGSDSAFSWTLAATPYDERQEEPAAKAQGEYRLGIRLLRVESRVAWHAADGRDRDIRLTTLVLANRP